MPTYKINFVPRNIDFSLLTIDDPKQIAAFEADPDKFLAKRSLRVFHSEPLPGLKHRFQVESLAVEPCGQELFGQKVCLRENGHKGRHSAKVSEVSA